MNIHLNVTHQKEITPLPKSKPNQIVESKFVKVDGPIVTFPKFTALPILNMKVGRWQEFQNVSVANMDELIGVIKNTFGISPDATVEIIGDGGPVKDLLTFSTLVAERQGDPGFHIIATS